LKWPMEEFELDRAKGKNNITENSFALGHETHNSYRNVINEAFAPMLVILMVSKSCFW